MKYPKKSNIEKMALDEVMAKLAIAGITLPTLRVYDDTPDPFLSGDFLTMDQQRERNAIRLDRIARESLFAAGVKAYVQRLGLADLNRIMREKKKDISAWQLRTWARAQREQALVTALMTEEEKSAEARA